MSPRSMQPRDDIRIDNLVADFGLFKARYAEDRAQAKRIEALLEHIARGLRTPIVVSRPQACAMLGISVKTAQRDPKRLPRPTKDGKYRVDDIVSMVAAEEPRTIRRNREEKEDQDRAG